jgi:predicted MFS family arabinose efflux permease
MMAVVFGHFTVIPFLSPFLVRNVGMLEKDLFLVYMVGGAVTVFTGPLVGRLADRFGKFRIYYILVAGACTVIYFLTSSGARPEWQVLMIAGFFFMFASARFIPTQATISMAVPPARRGAYMSLVACARDLASGITTSLGGMVVVEGANGKLQGYDRLGQLAIGISIVSLWIFRRVKSAETK